LHTPYSANRYLFITNMAHYWEPGTMYNYNDVVEYEGHRYKIVQPHRSQSDWAPPNTPALWGRLQDQDRNEGHNQQQYNQQPSTPSQQQPQGQGQSQNWNSDHKADPQKDEHKNWYDLSDDRKKDAIVAGGLATGLALLGGAYYQHQSHKKEGEEEKAQAWQLQNWSEAATQRTDRFLREGPTAPYTWIFSDALYQNPDLGRDAIEGGSEKGGMLVICRAPHHGGVQVGKAILGQNAMIGFKHDAIEVKKFEFLVGNMSGLRWVPQRGKPNLGGHRPVEGGNEDDGSPLFVARAEYKGSVIPGKASPSLEGAYITYGDDEKQVKEYEILVFA